MVSGYVSSVWGAKCPTTSYVSASFHIPNESDIPFVISEAESVVKDGNKMVTQKLFDLHEESNCCLRQLYVHHSELFIN